MFVTYKFISNFHAYSNTFSMSKQDICILPYLQKENLASDISSMPVKVLVH